MLFQPSPNSTFSLCFTSPAIHPAHHDVTDCAMDAGTAAKPMWVLAKPMRCISVAPAVRKALDEPKLDTSAKRLDTWATLRSKGLGTQVIQHRALLISKDKLQCQDHRGSTSREVHGKGFLYKGLLLLGFHQRLREGSLCTEVVLVAVHGGARSSTFSSMSSNRDSRFRLSDRRVGCVTSLGHSTQQPKDHYQKQHRVH